MNSFGDRLKSLRKTHRLRQKDLADKLGLAQTTIANYEQNTRFPNEKILKEIADIFEVSVDYLLGRVSSPFINNSNIKSQLVFNFNSVNKSNSLTSLKKKFFNSLINGNKDFASQLILSAVNNGISIKDIYLLVIEPCMNEIGLLWETNKINIADEHYFTEATRSIMSQLHPYISSPNKNNHSIVLFAANGDYHNIGLKMVNDFFEIEGWNTYYLGINIPTQSIIKTILNKKIDILAISVTMPFNINSAENAIHTIRTTTGCENVKIIVGGRAFSHDNKLWKQIGADGYAKNAEEAVKVANKLIQNKI
ncbi:cobalamin-dependent protein [Caldisalinibacter kiritimatiensis]|uniref:Uncharacterized protein n=1 Tax=Caldisalinibacter kiritimatiensis TaxID=1304284 RepID=R1CWP7_9FIRM|nr:cobalamin-dependent protein [Caldisalinibacter kiritimatiensis]EOD01034.1 hypothetical protein L21TH_0936 [Caldisalinibacter kiritimatiensis]